MDTLLRFGREDQDGREAFAQAAVSQDTAVIFSTMRADSARTRWLQAAVARHGWPGRTSAGVSAKQAAWLILQHSPDTAWQAAMLPDGRLVPAPVADVAGLDARRASMGLPPTAEYVRVLTEQTKLPVVWPPVP